MGGGAYSIAIAHTPVRTYVSAYMRTKMFSEPYLLKTLLYLILISKHRYIIIKYRSSLIEDVIGRLIAELWPLILYE